MMSTKTANNEASASTHGYTAGPWGVERTSSTNWIGPMRADGEKIAEIVAQTDRDQLTLEATFRNDANAELIAAAPELLSHLKHMIWLVETELQHDGGHIVENAKAVVAKVTV